MIRFYKSIKWVSAHRDMRLTTGFAEPQAKMPNDQVLKNLNMRIIGARIDPENDQWLVDVKFGKGIFSGFLFIDKPTQKLFVRLFDFLGAQPEIFLE